MLVYIIKIVHNSTGHRRPDRPEFDIGEHHKPYFALSTEGELRVGGKCNNCVYEFWVQGTLDEGNLWTPGQAERGMVGANLMMRRSYEKTGLCACRIVDG